MKSLIVLTTLAALSLYQSPRPEVAQALRGTAALHNRMRDPDSFVVEKVMTLTNKKGFETTCIEYRARNGFGGMDRNAAIYTEHNSKPHLDMNGRTGYGWCGVTKYNPYVDITKEVLAAEKAAK